MLACCRCENVCAEGRHGERASEPRGGGRNHRDARGERTKPGRERAASAGERQGTGREENSDKGAEGAQRRQDAGQSPMRLLRYRSVCARGSLELGADVAQAHARLAVRGRNLRDITGSCDALKPAHGATTPRHSTATSRGAPRSGRIINRPPIEKKM
jgi:hypothetical protein